MANPKKNRPRRPSFLSWEAIKGGFTPSSTRRVTKRAAGIVWLVAGGGLMLLVLMFQEAGQELPQTLLFVCYAIVGVFLLIGLTLLVLGLQEPPGWIRPLTAEEKHKADLREQRAAAKAKAKAERKNKETKLDG